MQMYRSWAANDYGVIKFEDFLTRVWFGRTLQRSHSPCQRSRRYGTCSTTTATWKCRSTFRMSGVDVSFARAESSEPESALPESVPAVAAVTSGEGEKELDLDEDVPAVVPSSMPSSSSIPASSSAPVSSPQPSSSSSTLLPSSTDNPDTSALPPTSLTRLSDVSAFSPRSS